MGGVPAFFKRFADEAGLRYDVSLETAAGQTLTWHLANKRAVIDCRWDVVVLQQYSTPMPIDRAAQRVRFRRFAG